MTSFLEPEIHKTWKPFRPEVELYPVIIKNRTTVEPMNVFDIGSHNGYDANYLSTAFNISSDNVFCFEPNPYTFKELTDRYPDFNNLQVGVSNVTTEASFNCVKSDSGISSTRRKIHLQNPTKDIESVNVNLIRMDDVMDYYNIQSIDICKIDVEGCAFEVLEGFGNALSKVKTLQIEAETVTLFEGQKLFPEVSDYLKNKGFHMVAFFSLGVQCDTVWVRNDLFRVN